jgi:hypothetical protein
MTFPRRGEELRHRPGAVSRCRRRCRRRRHHLHRHNHLLFYDPTAAEVAFILELWGRVDSRKF